MSAEEAPVVAAEGSNEQPVVEQPAPETPQVPESPLSKLTERLDDIIKQAEHGEMWGINLSADASHIPTQIVLQKFLRANSNDVAAAEKQLTSALEWRKKIDPLALVEQAFDRSKFNGLGYITTHKNEAGKEIVITWNIYGAVKDKKATFGDVEEFIKWRAALMELSVQQLYINDATEPIPDNGDDQYQMLQVHDYQSVSFFRMDSDVKAASKETIQTLSMAYPELLAHKYFVNVPAIMGWMFGAMKFFLAPATLKKFHPMSSGTSLSNELKDISSTLPSEYGGQGPSVKESMTVVLTEPVEEPEADGSKGESSQDEAAAEDGAAESNTKEEAPVLPAFNVGQAANNTTAAPPTLDGAAKEPADASKKPPFIPPTAGQSDKGAGEIEYV